MLVILRGLGSDKLHPGAPFVWYPQVAQARTQPHGLEIGQFLLRCAFYRLLTIASMAVLVTVGAGLMIWWYDPKAERQERQPKARGNAESPAKRRFHGPHPRPRPADTRIFNLFAGTRKWRKGRWLRVLKGGV